MTTAHGTRLGLPQHLRASGLRDAVLTDACSWRLGGGGLARRGAGCGGAGGIIIRQQGMTHAVQVGIVEGRAVVELVGDADAEAAEKGAGSDLVRQRSSGQHLNPRAEDRLASCRLHRVAIGIELKVPLAGGLGYFAPGHELVAGGEMLHDAGLGGATLGVLQRLQSLRQDGDQREQREGGDDHGDHYLGEREAPRSSMGQGAGGMEHGRRTRAHGVAKKPDFTPCSMLPAPCFLPAHGVNGCRLMMR